MNGFPPGCWQAIRQNSIFESKGDTKPLMMLSSLKLLINWKANKRKELFTVGDRLQSQTPSWGQLLSPCPPWLCEEWRLSAGDSSLWRPLHSSHGQGAGVSSHTGLKCWTCTFYQTIPITLYQYTIINMKSFLRRPWGGFIKGYFKVDFDGPQGAKGGQFQKGIQVGISLGLVYYKISCVTSNILQIQSRAWYWSKCNLFG